jgi:hypothetical protein
LAAHADEQGLLVVGHLKGRGLRGWHAFDGIALQEASVAGGSLPGDIVEDAVDQRSHGLEAMGGSRAWEPVTDLVGVENGRDEARQEQVQRDSADGTRGCGQWTSSTKTCSGASLLNLGTSAVSVDAGACPADD